MTHSDSTDDIDVLFVILQSTVPPSDRQTCTLSSRLTPTAVDHNMSSRALRKLQREQEEQRLKEAAEAAQEEAQLSSEDEAPTRTPPPRNAFDMLEEVEEDESEDETTGGVMTPATDASRPDLSISTSTRPTPSAKSKKKKKKSKKKLKDTPDKMNNGESESGDEVDRALKALAAKSASQGGMNEDSLPMPSWEAEATRLLGVETKNLNPINEMKSLFGNVAVEEHESRPANRNPRQREVNEQGGMDLGTALLGRNNVASRRKELGALAGRKNCLMRGREDWPLASSGGLSMEHVADPTSFERKYNILHNNMYKEAQWNFQLAVDSMDPQRMMSLLLMAPYHIASLLQVAEIARHQGDHSVSADLLERALYTFGKSVHSSFPVAMREGTVRLSFDKPANRELYLTIWRYIRNLEMRGTFKTAFEWAKLLLQLNTQSDPYGVTLMIDQLALRGRSHDQLISLASEEAYGGAWQHLPNIKISLVLAHMRAKQPKEARHQLAVAMHQYPYILSALASALDISPLPKALWAQVPSTDAEKLYTELYVERAKDLWNTPETSALLVEVAETLKHYSAVTSTAPPPPKLEISLEEARHILLLESPTLLALLPRNFTRMATTGYDPLPPPSSESDFTARPPQATDNSGPSAIQNLIGAGGNAAGGMLNRILNWFTSPAGPNANPNEGEDAIRELREELGPGVPDDIIDQLIAAHIDDGGDEAPNIDPERLGLGDRFHTNAPGGWNSDSDEDHDDDSLDMPELEDIPTAETRPTSAPTPPPPQPFRNPRAAMVEEDIDDDDDALVPQNTAAAAPLAPLLRHVDELLDDSNPPNTNTIRPHPTQPTHTLLATNAPPQTPLSPSERRRRASLSQLHPQTEPEPDIDADPQRLQRWLLTTGLSDLKPGQSTAHPAVAEYVRRMRLLRPQQREWVLGMMGQRGEEGKGVVEVVRRGLA